MSILEAIRRRYAAPGWAVFEEIPNTTGFEADRRADALALGIWPSHGYVLHGFEIKSSRADWLQELQDPEKGDAFLRYCDHWWLIAEPKVAIESEIPTSWGWMEVTKTGVRIRKDAPRLTPEPTPRSLMASMLRSVEKTMVPKSMLDKAYTEMQTDFNRKNNVEAYQRKAAVAEERLESLQATVKQFELQTGIRIDSYQPEVSIRQARILLDADQAMSTMRLRAQQIARMIDTLAKDAANVLAVTEPPST